MVLNLLHHLHSYIDWPTIGLAYSYGVQGKAATGKYFDMAVERCSLNRRPHKLQARPSESSLVPRPINDAATQLPRTAATAHGDRPYQLPRLAALLMT